MANSPLPKVALIAGPTASGKSALAMALAERANGVVINADSAQVYRDLRIVTARPSPADEVRVPHALYGYRDGALPCSAADWAQDAKATIADVHSQGRLPVLVGGTGLYIRTLFDGIAPVPDIDPEVREEVRSMALGEMHARLAHEDPEAAARLRPTDATRIARALEVVRATRRPLWQWQREKVGGIGASVAIKPLILLPPREWLYPSCDRRFGEMMSEQGIDEVVSLLARGLPAALPVMRAIGVPEIAAFLAGAMSREAALEAGRTATRQYAKRQYTWFRRQPPTDWPRFEEAPIGDAFGAALARLEN